MQKCFPKWEIQSFMMMADKSKVATIDGLNQMFRISKNSNNRTGITKTISSINQAGESVLGRKNITTIIEGIESNKYMYNENLTFQESINQFKELYQNDNYANSSVSYSSCKSCEFKANLEQEQQGLKSGFKECFKKQLNWGPNEFQRPNIFDVWNFRKGGKLFEQGLYFKDELSIEDIGYKEDVGRLSSTARQWLQIEKEVNKDNTIFVDSDALKEEMKKWVFPLHFIDFETSAVALPFNKGVRPYEQVGFQFSHHIYREDGSIAHASEYINSKAGFFPNFEFVRELKKALDHDNGTIFRYSNHENSILNAIYTQLMVSSEPDKDDLISFIQSISHSKSDSVVEWTGARDMVDLWQVVKDYYYNPLTKGSNSIKAVLPAALSSSKFLQAKYASNIGAINLTSKNFDTNHIWLKIENNEVVNPYKMLPKVFAEWTDEQIENSLSEIEDIADGGAALTAYGKLQYMDMTNEERKELTSALLKYCELDTLAMVMIFEHFKEDLI
jgi:hypothetical protein